MISEQDERKLRSDLEYWKKRALAQKRRLDSLPPRSFISLVIKCKKREHGEKHESKPEFFVDTAMNIDSRDSVRVINALRLAFNSLNESFKDGGGRVEFNEMADLPEEKQS